MPKRVLPVEEVRKMKNEVRRTPRGNSTERVKPKWLSGMDSNHDKSLQRALCYHYTTGQAESGANIGWNLGIANLKLSRYPGTHRKKKRTPSTVTRQKTHPCTDAGMR